MNDFTIATENRSRADYETFHDRTSRAGQRSAAPEAVAPNITHTE